jgi:protein SCO1/2
LACAIAAFALACGGSGDEGYEGGGVVRGLRADEAQITIEHHEIEGLMPAMTMSFDVAAPALLDGLAEGDYVEFHLVREGEAFVIDAITRPGGMGSAGSSGGGAVEGDTLADVSEPAPDFALVDQDGRPLSLASLRGKPVLLDFVFTRCPGPCPVLTGIHREVREGLDADAKARVHSVSITLDPRHDTPEVLRAFVDARRIESEGWSFATGPVEDIEAVVAAYGVGSIREPDGNIVHTVATFLIDADGHIAKRYLGLRHDPKAIRADVEALL